MLYFDVLHYVYIHADNYGGAMTERPDQPRDEDILTALDDIIVGNHELQYLEIAQVTGNLYDAMNTNLDKIRGFAEAHYETLSAIPELNIYQLQTTETEAFGAVASVVMAEPTDMPDKIKTMAGIYTQAAQERVNLFNQLIPAGEDGEDQVEAWAMAATERYMENLAAEAQNIDELILKLKQHYFEDIADDYETLVSQLELVARNRQPDNADAAASESTPSGAKTVGEHALDVAKITVGVLGALAVDRLIRRRLR